MAETKHKGQVAEIEVMRLAVRRGYRVSLPLSEDCPYDLVVERLGRVRGVERVQCKYVRSNGDFIVVRCRTSNQTCERRYTAEDIDWLATFDVTTDACYFVPATMLGPAGRATIHLRLTPPRNNQRANVWWANDFIDW